VACTTSRRPRWPLKLILNSDQRGLVGPWFVSYSIMGSKEICNVPVNACHELLPKVDL
jgi:hypothetical protein